MAKRTRTFADGLLFGVTVVELALLFYLVPSFTIVDWIYIAQHVMVTILHVLAHLFGNLRQRETRGLEQWEQMPGVDRVRVPVGIAETI
jgi:putative exporter of polyketide antibiotics